jgi:hypothetical protein
LKERATTVSTILRARATCRYLDLADMLVNGIRIIAEDAETGEDDTSEILDRLD